THLTPKQQKLLIEEIEVKQKYDKPWWEAKDPRDIAYYQIQEEVMLVDPQVFYRGVALITGKTQEDAENSTLMFEERIKQKILSEYQPSI
ncbi:MAG: hypothetical protein ACM3KR_08305, partial [Deltaproteobacteria bacterium]